jgi:sec-independent protein translocase protein TatC
VLLAAPVIVWIIAWFVFPGLTARERMALRRGGLVAVGLFVVGVAMGYAMTLPVALRMMLGINSWLGEPQTPFVDLADFVAFELKLLLGFGLAFQLPVVLLALGSVGIISSKQLREKRRHVIVCVFVLAMLLTPPDPITQVMMALPLALLYEACVWLLRAMERRRSS